MLLPQGKQLHGVRLTWTTVTKGPCSGKWQADKCHGPVVKTGLVPAFRQLQGAAVVPLPLNWKEDFLHDFNFRKKLHSSQVSHAGGEFGKRECEGG